MTSSFVNDFWTPEYLAQVYDVSKNGFLPGESPLCKLSDIYYAPWERILAELSHLYKSSRIRTEVHRLPILSTSLLNDASEWKRAYSVLTFITHAYIWGGEKPAEVLPPAITIPLLSVSEHLELPPVATYASLNLWNYQPCGEYSTVDFEDSGSVRMIHTITGTEDENWFYLISVMAEAQAARAIPLMLDAIRAASEHNQPTVIEALCELTSIIKHVGLILDRMHEHCQPATFYHQIRPALAGSKNMASAGLPNGVFYDQGNGYGEWMQLRGGSNAQSSLIQFFDAVLSVVHKSTGELETAFEGLAIPFHQEMRSYMPGPHRRFLNDIARITNVRAFAMAESAHPLQLQLKEAYQGAIGALSDLRGLHLQIVARYIIIPSRQAAETGRMNLAVASSTSLEQDNKTRLTGTGGTNLIPFLKQTREETDAAGEMRREV